MLEGKEKRCHLVDRCTITESSTMFLKALTNNLFCRLDDLLVIKAEFFEHFWSCVKMKLYPRYSSQHQFMNSLAVQQQDWWNELFGQISEWMMIGFLTYLMEDVSTFSRPISFDFERTDLLYFSNGFKCTEANDKLGQLWLTVHLPKLPFTASFVSCVIPKSWRFHNSLNVLVSMMSYRLTHRMSGENWNGNCYRS